MPIDRQSSIETIRPCRERTLPYPEKHPSTVLAVWTVEEFDMNVKIEVIPHDQQLYPTVGDWRFDDKGDLIIRVSKLSDWRREMLIAIHELCEVVLCKQRGITTESVDKFDKDFESTRHPDNEDEPGDEPSAPYVNEHCIATGIERIMAAELGVKWKEYEEELGELP